MTLLESLLDAIIRLEGDALVMHVGEKPYVVTTSSSMNAYRGPLAWGQVELSSRVLTSEAVLSMVSQILPIDQRQALDDLGAVEHEITAPVGTSDRFTVVAARGGEDIWLELRRHPAATPKEVEQPAASEAATGVAEAGAAAEGAGVAVGLRESPPASEPASVEPPHQDARREAATVEETTIEERVPVLDEVGSHSPEHFEHIRIPVSVPEAERFASPAASAEREEAIVELVHPEAQDVPTDADVDALLAASAEALLTGREDMVGGPETLSEGSPALAGERLGQESLDAPAPPEPAFPHVGDLMTPVPPPDVPAEAAAEMILPEPPVTESAPETFAAAESTFAPRAPDEFVAQPSPMPEIPVDKSTALPISRPDYSTKYATEAMAGMPDSAHGGKVVVPMSRPAGKADKPAPGGRVDDEALLKILRVAAERGASTVYVVAQARPMARIDGEISVLEGEPMLAANDVERLIMSLAPRRPDTPAEAQLEWISEVPDVGRVRCLTFRDHRGPGLIFRMIPAKSISADHLNLSPEIRDLAAQADGFVLVTGARGSGKSTLLNSFVDLINRSRSDHVITVESEIGYVHESRRSFVSQREVHGGPAAAAAVHAALREDPDVLVIEDLQSPEGISAALEAAESGRLVFASINAPSAVAAIDAMIEMFPAGQRAAARAALARTLRAVVSQVLLRKASGGRVTARELLLNSPTVAASIREGKSSDVAAALEGGQRHGMVSMSDALATLVRGGTVHSAEAYRRAPDRAALLACLARDGVDTSFAERLA